MIAKINFKKRIARSFFQVLVFIKRVPCFSLEVCWPCLVSASHFRCSVWSADHVFGLVTTSLGSASLSRLRLPPEGASVRPGRGVSLWVTILTWRAAPEEAWCKPAGRTLGRNSELNLWEFSQTIYTFIPFDHKNMTFGFSNLYFLAQETQAGGKCILKATPRKIKSCILVNNDLIEQMT